MKVQLNLAGWHGITAIPADVAEKHLKLASHEALKVILALARLGTQVEEETLCRDLGITPTQLNEALLYWESAGLLCRADAAVSDAAPAAKPKVVVKRERATRGEIALRASESREIALVLRQAETVFARPLKETEKGALVYILDDLGVKPQVALMLLELAAAQGRTTASFLEATAVDWVNRGIDSVAAAEKEMALADEKRQAWATVKRALSIEDRRPSAKESEAVLRWTSEWGFDETMLRLAYDQCVDRIGKVSFPYINKILEGWHTAGVKTPKAAAAQEKKDADKKEKKPSFDLTLF
ncbi:MAG: DnaD domain protein [Clostridia bacterium]|nr:DnaD domain protein [Clostridia bacterium]